MEYGILVNTELGAENAGLSVTATCAGSSWIVSQSSNGLFPNSRGSRCLIDPDFHKVLGRESNGPAAAGDERAKGKRFLAKSVNEEIELERHILFTHQRRTHLVVASASSGEPGRIQPELMLIIIRNRREWHASKHRVRCSERCDRIGRDRRPPRSWRRIDKRCIDLRLSCVWALRLVYTAACDYAEDHKDKMFHGTFGNQREAVTVWPAQDLQIAA
jgi:hypothetical protein